MARAPHPRRSHTPLIDLVTTASEATDASDAVTVLRLGSELLAGGAGDDSVEIDQIVASLAANDDVGATALLIAIQTLTDDDLRRARLRRIVAQRSIPPVLADLENGTAGLAAEFVDVLHDTSALVVGITLPNNQPLVALAYIDHHHSGVVKDAFVVGADQDHITEVVRQQRPTPHHRLLQLHPADARARLEVALSKAHRLVARQPTETWPSSRPLLAWLCRQLPLGGQPRRRLAWTDEARTELAATVARSTPEPMPAATRSTLDVLIQVASSLGSRDPLSWSPVAVELLFTERLAHAVAIDGFDPQHLLPALSALVRFAHLERGVPAPLTTATLAAAERCVDELPAMPSAPSKVTARPLLDTLSELDNQGIDLTSATADEPVIDRVDFGEVLRASLHRAVGGEAALRALDTAPLPDERFDWSVVPPELKEAVAAVVDQADTAATELFHREARTAVRRLIARLVESGSTVFSGNEPQAVALAVCWIVGQANALLDEPDQRAELAAHFGASLPSKLVRPMLGALFVDPHQHGGLDLGMPDLLVSSRRELIVAQRDASLGDG